MLFYFLTERKKRFKELYPNIAKLEELAGENNVPIYEPFQGSIIGDFTVLAPSKSRYLDLIVESEKTPEATKAEQESLLEAAGRLFKKAVEFIRSAWGEEVFPEEDTSPENNMSVVQYANLFGEKILLTGDPTVNTSEGELPQTPESSLEPPLTILLHSVPS